MNLRYDDEYQAHIKKVAEAREKIAKTNWNLRVKGIQKMIGSRKAGIARMNKVTEQWEQEIERLKKLCKPYWKIRNEHAEAVRRMEWQLEKAKMEAKLQNLKIGDVLILVHSRYTRGQYDVYWTMEEASKRKGVLHSTVVTRIKDDTIIVKEGRKEYISKVSRSLDRREPEYILGKPFIRFCRGSIE